MIIVIATFLVLVYVVSRLTCGIAKTSACLVGKTAIVTGGNSGVGYEICLNLASRGCRVIILDKDDSTKTREKIIQITKNANIVSKIVDLASFQSIRNFSKDFNQTEERLDILINNAGIGSSNKLVTEDGLNYVMQVNYFGPFLLTHLLIDKLKKSVPSRIIFTSSLLAFCGDLRNRDYVFGRKVNNLIQVTNLYADSKLATIMASDIFAAKLEKAGITCNSLHPGVILTTIFDSLRVTSSVFSFLNVYALFWLFSKTVWEGAQTSIHLATSEKVEKVSGKFFSDCGEFIKPFQARDEELCRKVWKTSEECVKLTEDEKIH